MAIINNNTRKNSIDQTLITTPSATDILCGKDKTFSRHEGNQAFRDMIVAYAPVYSKAVTKQAKMQLTKEIVTTLHHSHNARFLQPSRCGHGWNEISDQVARDKCSHALRFAAKSHGYYSSSGSSTSSDSYNQKRKSMAAACNKKSHRRQVSWTVLDGSYVATVRMDRTRSPSPLVTRSSSGGTCQDDLEPIDWKQTTPEPFIFERQQMILKSLVDPTEYGYSYSNSSTRNAAPLAMSRHDFDSLRSEDFESLMSDPALMNAVGEFPDEWVAVPL
jgi:hypothetical protein